jgi:hypothetical protein
MKYLAAGIVGSLLLGGAAYSQQFMNAFLFSQLQPPPPPPPSFGPFPPTPPKLSTLYWEPQNGGVAGGNLPDFNALWALPNNGWPVSAGYLKVLKVRNTTVNNQISSIPNWMGGIFAPFIIANNLQISMDSANATAAYCHGPGTNAANIVNDANTMEAMRTAGINVLQVSIQNVFSRNTAADSATGSTCSAAQNGYGYTLDQRVQDVTWYTRAINAQLMADGHLPVQFAVVDATNTRDPTTLTNHFYCQTDGVIVGSISGNVLTVSSVQSGTIPLPSISNPTGDLIVSGSLVVDGTNITSQLSGTPNGVGTYHVSGVSQTVPLNQFNVGQPCTDFYAIFTYVFGQLASPPGATFTGSIKNSTLTVTTTPPSGGLRPGQIITGAGVTAGTTIVNQNSSTGSIKFGGTGNYAISPSQTVNSESMTASWPAPAVATCTNPGCTVAISGNVATVTGTPVGSFGLKQALTGAGVAANTYITQLGTGTGGAGTYGVNNAQTVAAETMTSSAGIPLSEFLFDQAWENYQDFQDPTVCRSAKPPCEISIASTAQAVAWVFAQGLNTNIELTSLTSQSEADFNSRVNAIVQAMGALGPVSWVGRSFELIAFTCKNRNNPQGLPCDVPIPTEELTENGTYPETRNLKDIGAYLAATFHN